MAGRYPKSQSISLRLLNFGWKVRAKAFGYNIKNIISQEVCTVDSHRRMSKVHS